MRVKAQIDGRPVDAVIVVNPWFEAAAAFRRFAEVVAGLDFTEAEAVSIVKVDPKDRRDE